jgi:hypothetical protein
MLTKIEYENKQIVYNLCLTWKGFEDIYYRASFTSRGRSYYSEGKEIQLFTQRLQLGQVNFLVKITPYGGILRHMLGNLLLKIFMTWLQTKENNK